MDSGLTASDVAVLSGSGRNNDGWGDGNGWWIILFLVFAMFGWGGFGGFGGFGGNNGGATPYSVGAATQADIQRGFDNQSVMNKLNGLEQGLCNGFYTQNTAMLQGFNGIGNQITNLGFQMQDCCCQTQRAIDGVNYNLATQACDTRNTIQTAARDILENNNANTRSILDFLVNDKISTLQAENQSLKLAASQQAQNAFFTANQDAQTAELIRRINPTPVPAYSVPAPYPYAGCGYNASNCC